MNNDLYHHGIKGQKWGVRRFQKNRSDRKRKEEADLTRRYNAVKGKGDPSFHDLKYETKGGLYRKGPFSKRPLSNRQVERVIKAKEKDKYADVVQEAKKAKLIDDGKLFVAAELASIGAGLLVSAAYLKTNGTTAPGYTIETPSFDWDADDWGVPVRKTK